jgi:hypothetical protein
LDAQGCVLPAFAIALVGIADAYVPEISKSRIAALVSYNAAFDIETRYSHLRVSFIDSFAFLVNNLRVRTQF